MIRHPVGVRPAREKVAAAIAAVQAYLDEEPIGLITPPAGNGLSAWKTVFWQDGRARNEAIELNSLVSDKQKISWWGSPMPIDASHVIARMLWVKRHKPNIWDKTKYVLLPSKAEGIGLPMIEAMICGSIPITCSDNEVIFTAAQQCGYIVSLLSIGCRPQTPEYIPVAADPGPFARPPAANSCIRIV